MNLTPQNTVAWHDATVVQHHAKLDEFAKQEFRTLSLTLYGAPSDPRLAAVMVERPVVIATRQFGPLNQGGIQKAFDDMVKEGYGPYILTATGPANSAVFSAVFTPMAAIPLTRLNLTAAQFTELNNQQKLKGNILLWADAFGTPQDTRYTAIWAPNPTRQAWNCDAIDENGAALQARFEAITSTWCRPALVAVTPAGRHLEMFVDSTMGAWSSRVGMTSAAYQTEFDDVVKKGLMPIHVSASGEGSNTKFAAIFADRDDVDQRVFRAKGPVTVPTIDDAMEQYVKDRDLRGVALAITLGTRLVYAKGYTFAEPAPIYPDILPTTVFRQASVSKTFAATAIWRLMQQNLNVTLNTTLQSILNLKQPGGEAPKDPRFKDITIRHLLESNSGLHQAFLYSSVDAAEAFGANLPATFEHLARYGAMFTLTGTPGSKTNVVYGNYDYFILSQIVAKLANASTFEQALNTLVLAPLSMTHTRGSRSSISSQAPGEARHHMRVYDPDNGWALIPMQIGASDRIPSRPTVAAHYGAWDYEIFDGSGGLSAAVIDVARLAAMFSDRSDNPVLSGASLDAMLSSAAKATDELDSPTPPDPKDKNAAHGYHGFDWARIDNQANHVYTASKGGWLPGQGSTVRFTTGGFGFVLAQNGNGARGVKTEWLDPVAAAAKAHAWPGKDLFPEFGMPSLTPTVLQIALSSEMLAKLVSRSTKDAVEETVVRQFVEARKRPI